MKGRILSVICITAVISAIVSGIMYVKISAKRQENRNVLPAVDILVIEDGRSMVYNLYGGAL